MERRWINTALLVAALAMVVAACTSNSDANGVEGTGEDASSTEIAPIFSVPTLDGGQFSLNEHLMSDGRPVFLNLWASWCFPCREEMPAIDAAAKAHPEIAFVGVAVQDSLNDAAEFADEIAVDYILAFDADNAIDSSYTPLGLPASYIISGDGVIVERIFGKITEDMLSEKFQKHFG